MKEINTIEEIEARVREIDDLLFNEEVELSDLERKSLETEREDLMNYLW